MAMDTAMITISIKMLVPCDGLNKRSNSTPVLPVMIARLYPDTAIAAAGFAKLVTIASQIKM